MSIHIWNVKDTSYLEITLLL